MLSGQGGAQACTLGDGSPRWSSSQGKSPRGGVLLAVIGLVAGGLFTIIGNGLLFVDVNTLTSSGMTAPARVPNEMIAAIFHHSGSVSPWPSTR